MAPEREDWDTIADDEREWGAPGVGTARARKETVVSVRLAADVAAAARQLAADVELPLSAWVRELIEQIVADEVSIQRSFDLQREFETIVSGEGIGGESRRTTTTGHSPIAS